MLSGLKLPSSKAGEALKPEIIRPVATVGLDIGKSTFHLVGLDKRDAIAMRTTR